VIKLTRTKWEGHIACVRKIRNPEEKRLLGKTRLRWED
jgi:hypothetical protein